MPHFSRVSEERLSTCHPDIQKVMREVVKYLDITISEGARDLETQKRYVAEGLSRTLNSKHLVQSDGYSHAVDIYPYPFNKEDREKWYYLGGFVLGVAKMLGVNLVWGGDWNQDTNLHNQTFFDLPHFELKE